MSAAVAAADPNVKQIQLVPGKGVEGEAGAPPSGGGAPKGAQQRRSRKQRKLQVGGEATGEAAGAPAAPTLKVSKEGGGATSPGTLVQLAATHTASVPGARDPVGVNAPLTSKGAAAGGGGALAGGTPTPAKPIKVVLAASKKKKSKVVLAAPAAPHAPVAAAAASASSSHRGVTRKAPSHARKIKVSMKTLRKKINKAKTIRKSAADTPLDQVKKELHKAGVLKADSKAPEPILRQMYADFMTLKSRAL